MWSPGREQGPNNGFSSCSLSRSLPLETKAAEVSLASNVCRAQFSLLQKPWAWSRVQFDFSVGIKVTCQPSFYPSCFLPQTHHQIKCAHNISNLMWALTVLTAERAHVLLSACLLAPDCPLAAAAFGFLAFVIEPMGYSLFYCLPFKCKAGFLSQRCHVSPFLLYCRVPWVAT